MRHQKLHPPILVVLKIPAFLLALLLGFHQTVFLPSLFAEDFQIQTRPDFLPERDPEAGKISTSPLGRIEVPDPTALFLGAPPLQPAQNPNQVVSVLPKTDQDKRPGLTSFVSFAPNAPDSAKQDWSNLQAKQLAPDVIQLDFNFYNTFSYGGVYANYDNWDTNPFESVNLSALFSGGLVLGFDNGGTQTSQALLGLIDTEGNNSWISIEGVTSTQKKWKILSTDFSGIDFNKIQGISILTQGRNVGGKLTIHLGNFPYTPTFASQAGDPQNSSPLPPLYNGNRPQLKHYATFDPWNPNAPLRDWSNARLDAFLTDFAQLKVNLYNTTSQAAAFFDYDNELTAQIETIDFAQSFSEGFTLGLDNGNSGDLREAFFAVMDANGMTDYVKLTGIDIERKYFTIDLSAFDEADLTQITEFGLYVEGRHANSFLNIDWGSFDYVPEFTTGKSAFDPSTLSNIASPDLKFWGANEAGSAAGRIALTVLNPEEFEYQYNLWQGETASTTVELNKGFFDAQGTFQGSGFSLPEYFVIAARGSENGHTRVVVTDIHHKELSFDLDLDSFYQNYTLHLKGAGVLFDFDINHIAHVRFVQDQQAHAQAWSDVVQIQLKGIAFNPGFIPETHQALREQILKDGLKYFELGKGVDALTHLPYDRSFADGTLHPTHKITQPTLTGFYLQLLGDFIRGKMDWEGRTLDQALQEIDLVLNSLNQIQTEYGWKGLIPWIDQGQPYPIVGIGDNANLAQSLAVMIGALELANLSASQRQAAQAITLKAEQFLNRQQEGYLAAVDTQFGIFAAAVNRTSGVQTAFLDRLMTEFRGAIAFLLIRYPTLPQSVWDNLVVKKDNDYVAQDGTTISNLQSYEGGAFQYFWPLLRNNERDFVGFRNALQNYFVTQTDYAARNHIPGFLSASDQPGQNYAGLVGIPQIAETQEPLVVDLGSTYSLASAFTINQYRVLDWLKEILEKQPALYGKYGFLDAARSNSEVAQFYLGIDLASTILALNDSGPEAFEKYLRNRNQEHSYNQLYDRAGQFGLDHTWVSEAAAPEFPDRSYSVFSHVQVDGTLGTFPYVPTTPSGVRLMYNGFGTSFDGRFWEMTDAYDAQANNLEIFYSVKDAPGKVRIELKDDSIPEKLLFETTVQLAGDNSPYQKLSIPLPNNTKFSNVKKVFLVIDQSTGDTRGDFTLHAINFQHLASSQSLAPLGTVPPLGGTTVQEPYAIELISSSPNSSLEIISQKEARLHYDIPQSGSFAAISLSAGPEGDGHFFDLSSKSKVVFGLNSPHVKSVKIEVDDANGGRAILYATGIDITRRYYEFLTASLQGSIDLTKVKRISFVVDQKLVHPDTLTGILELEIL